jgi:hypothetical protein
MKTLFITLFAFISLNGLQTNQDKITVNATFDGYEDETYYFTDEEDGVYEFQKIDSVASSKYDLQNAKFKGEKFEVTYTIETDLDENDDEYSLYTILDLKLYK